MMTTGSLTCVGGSPLNYCWTSSPFARWCVGATLTHRSRTSSGGSPPPGFTPPPPLMPCNLTGARSPLCAIFGRLGHLQSASSSCGFCCSAGSSRLIGSYALGCLISTFALFAGGTWRLRRTSSLSVLGLGKFGSAPPFRSPAQPFGPRTPMT